MADEVTVLICARNAEKTIERAVNSAKIQGNYSIILVDDCSIDSTVELARRAGGIKLVAKQLDEHTTLGYARAQALRYALTPWVIWLDADDEFLPGHINAMLAEAKRVQADIVYTDAELYDGIRGGKVKDLLIPEFIRRDHTGLRNLERNYIPSCGWPLMQRSVAPRLSYDPDIHGVEDYDFQFRAAMDKTFVFGYKRGVTYRQHAYPDSVSRNLSLVQKELKKIYRKFSDEEILSRIILNSGSMVAHQLAYWTLVSINIFQERWPDACVQLYKLYRHSSEIIEPDGPYPYPERWRYCFQLGTLCLKFYNDNYCEAENLFKEASLFRVSADLLNNLGVCYRKQGKAKALVDSMFREALKLFPGYLDAEKNLADEKSEQLTMLPLRMLPSRNDYTKALPAPPVV